MTPGKANVNKNTQKLRLIWESLMYQEAWTSLGIHGDTKEVSTINDIITIWSNYHTPSQKIRR